MSFFTCDCGPRAANANAHVDWMRTPTEVRGLIVMYTGLPAFLQSYSESDSLFAASCSDEYRVGNLDLLGDGT